MGAVQHSSMNASLNVESPWKTYPRAIAFALPAICAWWFSCVFLLPKLKQIWVETGFDNSTARGILYVFVGWANYWFIIGIALAALLGLLEWRSNIWRRYRRVIVNVAAFLLNASILFFITAMFTYGLVAVSR